MLSKINHLLTSIIIAFALSFLASSAHIYIEHHLRPQQISWHASVYTNGLITLLLIAAFAAIRSLVRRFLQKST